MSDLILLEDYTENFKYELLNEEKKEGNYYIRGVFAKAGIKNKNGRYYPMNVMQESVRDVQDLIKNNGFVGQLEHPSTPKINVEKISHKITGLEMSKDGTVVGEMKVLNTKDGRILQDLINENIRLGVSTRGLGKLTEDNSLGESVLRVEPGYKLKAIDIVFDPSAGTYPDMVAEDTQYNVVLGGTAKFSEVWESIFGGVK